MSLVTAFAQELNTMANVKLGTEIRQLVNNFPASITNLDRQTIISTCIARAISLLLPIPSSPVEQIQSHYTLTHHSTVMQLVSEFNECIIINVVTTMDLVYKFYELRYNVCHSASDLPALVTALACCNPDSFPTKVSDVITRASEAGEKSNDYFMGWDYFVQSCVREIKERNGVVTGDINNLA